MSNVPRPQAPTSEALISSILDLKFPLRATFEGLQQLAGRSASSNGYLEMVNEYRAQLTIRSEPELRHLYAELLAQARHAEAQREAERQAKAARKAAEQEAKRFYNQANAQPDFSFWAKLEYWTFEEAVALLLKKNPEIVTRAAVQRELNPPQLFLSDKPQPTSFLLDYLRLWAIAERAEAMTRSPRLRPGDVVAWAIQSAAVPIPAELDALTRATRTRYGDGNPTDTAAAGAETHGSPADTVTAADSASAAAATAAPDTPKGTALVWTEAKKAELRAHKERHGTKAAAEKFGISQARVRQVLGPQVQPTTFEAHDPFARRR